MDDVIPNATAKDFFIAILVIAILVLIGFGLGRLSKKPTQVIDLRTVETINPEEQLKQEEQRVKEKAQHDAWVKSYEIKLEQSKMAWIKANPPVETLFDQARVHDTEYVINYLSRNKIAGSCALVWYPDVVCAEGRTVVFPTERSTK